MHIKFMVDVVIVYEKPSVKLSVYFPVRHSELPARQVRRGFGISLSTRDAEINSA